MNGYYVVKLSGWGGWCVGKLGMILDQTHGIHASEAKAQAIVDELNESCD